MNSEQPQPPTIIVEPAHNDLASTPQPHSKRPKGIWSYVLAGLVAFGKWILALGKILIPLLKLSKIGLTAGSMLVSVWVYAFIFGWKFALGFVLCIFVHEMGHVAFAAMLGLPVSAPVFIPYLGAMIMLKQVPRTTLVDAVIGIGGPLFGALSGVICWGLFAITGNYLFLGLAFVAFFMNLFNLTPIYPLDGGRIVSAISPWLWVAGLAMMIGLFVTGTVRNPFIWIIIIMSVPQLWLRMRHGIGPTPATPEQRLIMGAAYVGLAGFLFWAMSATHVDIEQKMRARNTAPVASLQR